MDGWIELGWNEIEWDRIGWDGMEWFSILLYFIYFYLEKQKPILDISKNIYAREIIVVKNKEIFFITFHFLSFSLCQIHKGLVRSISILIIIFKYFKLVSKN